MFLGSFFFIKKGRFFVVDKTLPVFNHFEYRDIMKNIHPCTLQC